MPSLPREPAGRDGHMHHYTNSPVLMTESGRGVNRVLCPTSSLKVRQPRDEVVDWFLLPSCWYHTLMGCRIDLHVHSWFSGDSDASPETLVQQAIRTGLDGIAFTEHYSYGASEEAEELRERYGGEIMIFRGVEFSAAEGHCLVFGVDTDKGFPRDAPMAEVVRMVNSRGGVVIPSHPYRGMNSVGDAVRSLPGICAVEGYNGCNSRPLNARALEAAAALNLPFTGGSDAHEAADVGSCYTLFSGQVTYDSFLDLLRAGNYFGVDVRKVSRGWLNVF